MADAPVLVVAEPGLTEFKFTGLASTQQSVYHSDRLPFEVIVTHNCRKDPSQQLYAARKYQLVRLARALPNSSPPPSLHLAVPKIPVIVEPQSQSALPMVPCAPKTELTVPKLRVMAEQVPTRECDHRTDQGAIEPAKKRHKYDSAVYQHLQTIYEGESQEEISDCGSVDSSSICSACEDDGVSDYPQLGELTPNMLDEETFHGVLLGLHQPHF